MTYIGPIPLTSITAGDIDSGLIAEGGGNQSASVLIIANGCICCSARSVLEIIQLRKNGSISQWVDRPANGFV